MTEAAFQKQVIQFARLLGWRVLHLRPGLTRRGRWVTAVQGDGKGFPDLLILKGRRCLVAELKVGKRRTTPDQEIWLAAFRDAGIPAYLWRPADWKEIEKLLT